MYLLIVRVDLIVPLNIFNVVDNINPQDYIGDFHLCHATSVSVYNVDNRNP
jgi:hypothetical protein